MTVKVSPHPPFGAQIMLNGHEYVACHGAQGGNTLTSGAPAQLGATRTGGVDLNKPRIRAALAAALALTAAPRGFTVAEFTAKVQAMTGQAGYTTRQAAYDLRKLRGKGLAEHPAARAGTTSRPALPAPSLPC